MLENYESQMHLMFNVQLQEARYARNMEEQASQHILAFQQEMLQHLEVNFEHYRRRESDEHRAVVHELRERRNVLSRRVWRE